MGFIRLFLGLGNNSKVYKRSCLWNEKTDPDCPVFRVGDILANAGISEETFDSSVMVQGGIVVIQIQCAVVQGKTYNCRDGIVGRTTAYSLSHTITLFF